MIRVVSRVTGTPIHSGFGSVGVDFRSDHSHMTGHNSTGCTTRFPAVGCATREIVVSTARDWVVLSGTGSLLYVILLTLASPMAVMIPVALTTGRRGSRDQRMADTIVERMASKEDGRALVLVGQYHVEPVAKQLRKRGLSVATESTQSFSGQVTFAVTRLINYYCGLCGR